ncbi:MAG: hypothetical protein AB8B93_00290 [Pseudomonadales bacterium]
MAQQDCYRIAPGKVAWEQAQTAGIQQRSLFASAQVSLTELQVHAGAAVHPQARSLYLLTAGQLTIAGGETLHVGDLQWFSETKTEMRAGAAGAQCYCLQPQANLGAELEYQTITSSALPWQEFDDPAGRPTQPVQVLLDGSLSVLRTRFDPAYIAGEHWHDFDTLYFIESGRMQFGDEGWFETGEIRAVHGGHSYGPERPGSAGVEFVLVSVGGPVALHWSDLDPPP